MHFMGCFKVLLRSLVGNLRLMVLFSAIRCFNWNHIGEVLSSLETVLSTAVISVVHVWIWAAQPYSLVPAILTFILLGVHLLGLLLLLLNILRYGPFYGWCFASILFVTLMSCRHTIHHVAFLWHILHVSQRLSETPHFTTILIIGLTTLMWLLSPGRKYIVTSIAYHIWSHRYFCRLRLN